MQILINIQEFWPSLFCLGSLASYCIAPPWIVMTQEWRVARTAAMVGAFWIVFLLPWRLASPWLSFSLSSLPFLALPMVSLQRPWQFRGYGRDTITSSPKENSPRYQALNPFCPRLMGFLIVSASCWFDEPSICHRSGGWVKPEICCQLAILASTTFNYFTCLQGYAIPSITFIPQFILMIEADEAKICKILIVRGRINRLSWEKKGREKSVKFS